MKISKELMKGSTVQLILSCLSDEDMYGYQIIKKIKTKSKNIFNMGEGTIYPILHRLEKQGFLKSYWEKQIGLPDKKYYKITEKGISKLHEEINEWKKYTKAVNNVINMKSV
ncbi:PadR family transcriptional regulator [Candidatus Dojkabacteria bacterium]|nr:PadR family transcriptional regulator [Candidatus Dojkabacteria bacterium]